MKSPYIIIIEDTLDKKNKEELIEIIRSNYISKQAKDNAYLISIINNQEPKEVFKFIESKVSFELTILIVELSKFYGVLFSEAIEWLEVHFKDKELFD